MEWLKTEVFSYMKYWRIETWTLIVAVVALVQVWLIAFYKRVLRSGKVEIYETGRPEIGYSSYGPTVGLYGTLRARDRDLFIRSAELEVVKLKDHSRKRFDWIAFRPLTTVVGRAITELEVKLPASFMLPTAQPYQYKIMFSDSSVRAIQIILRNIQDKWIGDLTASGKLGRLRDTTGDLAKQQQRLAQIVNETYSEFTLRAEYSAAVESMRALNIWEAGNYQVTLIVHTAKPTRKYRKSWLFVPNEADEENFLLNPPKILQELCTEVAVPHFFAFPEYIHDNILTRAHLDKK